MSDFWIAVLVSAGVSSVAVIVQIITAYFMSKWIAKRMVKELFDEESFDQAR